MQCGILEFYLHMAFSLLKFPCRILTFKMLLSHFFEGIYVILQDVLTVLCPKKPKFENLARCWDFWDLTCTVLAKALIFVMVLLLIGILRFSSLFCKSQISALRDLSEWCMTYSSSLPILRFKYLMLQDFSESLAVIGRYISENYNGVALHPIDFIDTSTGQLVAEVMDPNITTICPVNKLHPQDDIMASGSSRCRI